MGVKNNSFLLKSPSDVANKLAEGIGSISLTPSYSDEFQRYKERIEKQPFYDGESVGELNAPISLTNIMCKVMESWLLCTSTMKRRCVILRKTRLYIFGTVWFSPKFY